MRCSPECPDQTECEYGHDPAKCESVGLFLDAVQEWQNTRSIDSPVTAYSKRTDELDES